MRGHIILPLFMIIPNPTFGFLWLWGTAAFKPNAYSHRVFRRKKRPNCQKNRIFVNTLEQMEHTFLSKDQNAHARLRICAFIYNLSLNIEMFYSIQQIFLGHLFLKGTLQGSSGSTQMNHRQHSLISHSPLHYHGTCHIQ